MAAEIAMETVLIPLALYALLPLQRARAGAGGVPHSFISKAGRYLKCSFFTIKHNYRQCFFSSGYLCCFGVMEAVLGRMFSSEDEEQHVLNCMAYSMIFMAVCTFVTLLKEHVPYGRYASRRFGFAVNVKCAWFVQELPAILLPVLLLLSTPAAKMWIRPNQLIITMYFCHYIHRSLIYPFLIRGGKPTPFISFALAFVFCIYNGYMQIRHLSHYAVYPAGWATHPCFILGSLLWLLGWLVNMHSDHILRNLRKPGETGYKIPRGGMFEYVSGANFLGEITEWAGFAVAAQSAQSVAFSIFTTVVLTSRAFSHHKWYLEKFEDYPKNRKALIPFLL